MPCLIETNQSFLNTHFHFYGSILLLIEWLKIVQIVVFFNIFFKFNTIIGSIYSHGNFVCGWGVGGYFRGL